MSETLTISGDLLAVLRQRAEQEGRSVDDLLGYLLSQTAPGQQPSPYTYLDAIPAAIAVVDVTQPGQPVVYVNHAFEAETGYTAAEVIGRNLNFLQGDERDQPARAVMREAIQNGQSCTVVLWNYHKDGRRFANEMRLAPLPDAGGRITRYIGIQHDVTQRVEAEEAHRRSESLYRLLVESSRNAIALHHPDGRFIYVNPSHKAISGYTAEELLALPVDQLRALVHPEDYERTLREAHEKARQGEMLTRLEYRLRRKDGSYVWLENTTAPILNEQGEVVQLLSSTRDISERKAFEERLAEQERFIASVLRAVPSFIYVYDLAEDRNVFANEGLTTLLGFTPAELQAMGSNVISLLVHPDDMTALLDGIQRAKDAPDDAYYYTNTYRLKHKDGGWRWIQDQGVIFQRDEAGAVRQILGAVIDISERVAAQEALRVSETAKREVLAAVKDVVYALALPSLDVLYMSDAVMEIMGYSVQDFYERRNLWETYIHPDDLADVRGGEAQVIAHGRYAWTFRVIRPDGTVRWVNNRAWLVRDEQGQPVRIAGIITDITEQKRTQELLDLQNAALESTANAIVITDRDASIQWVNPAFTRLTGYTIEEARGRNPNTLVKSGHHDQAFYEAMWQTILSGRVWFGKLVNRRKDGTLYTEEQTITPVYDNDGRISHFIAVKQDITERERSQQFMLNYEGLKARFQKEQEQNVLIQRTIAALSHDIRTPLSVIATTKDILSRYFDRLSDELRQEKLDNIGRQLQYAIELLDDTVEVAKSNLNHQVFRPAPVNLDALCRVSVEEMSIVHGRTHRLRFDNQAGIETAHIDEILISRILLNLLSNAIKYSPAGGEIRLELDRDAAWLILRVVDHGIGIGPADLPHIFEPFYRAETVAGVGGTGLGLSIVKDCVERHEGRIHVQSTPGEGSMFIVELPLIAL